MSSNVSSVCCVIGSLCSFFFVLLVLKISSVFCVFSDLEFVFFVLLVLK